MNISEEIIRFNFPADTEKDVEEIVGEDTDKVWKLVVLIGKILKKYKDGKLEVL